MNIELNQEKVDKIKEFYEKETKHMDLGERDDIGAHNGIVGVLYILGIEIEGVNM